MMEDCWLVGSCMFKMVNPPGKVCVVYVEGWLSGFGAVADGCGNNIPVCLLRNLVHCPIVLGGNTNWCLFSGLTGGVVAGSVSAAGKERLVVMAGT